MQTMRKVGMSRRKEQRKGHQICPAGCGHCCSGSFIVLPLLSSADEGFQRMMQNSGLYIQEHFLYTIARMILSLPVAAYLFGLIYGGFISGTQTGWIKNHSGRLRVPSK